MSSREKTGLGSEPESAAGDREGAEAANRKEEAGPGIGPDGAAGDREGAKKTGPNYGGRPRMPVAQRAKQFAPFAAVTGLDRAMRNVERELESIDRKDLSEDEESIVNEHMAELKSGQPAYITYYMDGRYITITGIVEEVDMLYHTIKMQDGTTIEMEDIIEVYNDLDLGQ